MTYVATFYRGTSSHEIHLSPQTTPSVWWRHDRARKPGPREVSKPKTLSHPLQTPVLTSTGLGHMPNTVGATLCLSEGWGLSDCIQVHFGRAGVPRPIMDRWRLQTVQPRGNFVAGTVPWTRTHNCRTGLKPMNPCGTRPAELNWRNWNAWSGGTGL